MNGSSFGNYFNITTFGESHGAALGVIKGSFIAGIISAVLNIAAPVINNPQLSDFVNGSAICNIIADLLK